MKIDDLMLAAVRDKKALAAFNAPSFDAMLGIARASAVTSSPVIIQASARLVKSYGPETIKSWFDTAVKNASDSCYLHLDHCSDLTLIKSCISAGWDMVMFDGSSLPIEENCRQTMEVVELAHASGAAVEGEVGTVGGEEDGHEAATNCATEDDIRKLAETGIDCIAVGFGNVHGDYSDDATLHWPIYEAAMSIGNLPLVLHGGSGLSDDEFKRAIRAGTAKINISTELKKFYLSAISAAQSDSALVRNPSLLHEKISNGVQRISEKYIRLFQSA